MMRELSTTVSPGSTEMCLWLSTATRESADIGSPWVPEIRIATLSGGSVHRVLRAEQDAVGNVQQAERVRDLGDDTMLRPITATRRPYSCARSSTSWMRWIEELKQETTTRFSARLKISSMRGRTARSDSV